MGQRRYHQNIFHSRLELIMIAAVIKVLAYAQDQI